MHTLSSLAELVGGEVRGDPEVKISAIGELAFALDKGKIKPAEKTVALAVVAPEETAKPTIVVKNPRLAMAKILRLFAPPCEVEKGTHPSAVVHETAILGNGVSIGPFVYVGPGAEIGDDTIIYPGATLYAGTVIGKRCVIHSGVRLGIDGYGFTPSGNKWEKIPQLGRVVIGDDVEIYANTCVARGTIKDTVIGRGTKIDTLTHIAHNCEIGEDCALTSLIGFAGSVKLGNNVQVGGQAGFAGHIEVGNNAVIMARAGVTKDVPANSIVSGFPAVDHKKDLETQAALRHLAKKK